MWYAPSRSCQERNGVFGSFRVRDSSNIYSCKFSSYQSGYWRVPLPVGQGHVRHLLDRAVAGKRVLYNGQVGPRASYCSHANSQRNPDQVQRLGKCCQCAIIFWQPTERHYRHSLRHRIPRLIYYPGFCRSLAVLSFDLCGRCR
jgi:hypothetical protein